MLDNWIHPIKDNVAFSNAYINWEDFKTKLKEGDETAWLEFDKITSELAREYGRDVEKEYYHIYNSGYEDGVYGDYNNTY